MAFKNPFNIFSVIIQRRIRVTFSCLQPSTVYETFTNILWLLSPPFCRFPEVNSYFTQISVTKNLCNEKNYLICLKKKKQQLSSNLSWKLFLFRMVYKNQYFQLIICIITLIKDWQMLRQTFLCSIVLSTQQALYKKLTKFRIKHFLMMPF